MVCLNDATEPSRRQDLHSREDAICSQADTLRKLDTSGKLQLPDMSLLCTQQPGSAQTRQSQSRLQQDHSSQSHLFPQ